MSGNAWSTRQSLFSNLVEIPAIRFITSFFTGIGSNVFTVTVRATPLKRFLVLFKASTIWRACKYWWIVVIEGLLIADYLRKFHRRVCRQISILRLVHGFSETSVLLRFHYALVFPILDNCSPVWGSPTSVWGSPTASWAPGVFGCQALPTLLVIVSSTLYCWTVYAVQG